jgi:hypothetical protein
VRYYKITAKEMIMDLETRKTELRNHSRFPYTYACDWLRMAGKAGSRSDAAQLYNGPEEAAVYAELYVIYTAHMDVAEALLKAAR